MEGESVALAYPKEIEMKRISDEEMEVAVKNQEVDATSAGLVVWPSDKLVAVAQAQLEACEEEHKAVISEIFDDIEVGNQFYHHIQKGERHYCPNCDTSLTIGIEDADWQALKQKYGGE